MSVRLYKRPNNAYDLMKRLRMSDLSLKERAVLLAQYSYGDVDGTSSYVSEKTLAEDLRIGVSTLRRHRSTLREAGWLVLRQRGVNVGSGGESRASTYEVVIPVATAGNSAVASEVESATARSATAHFSASSQLATARNLAPTVGTEDQDSHPSTDTHQEVSGGTGKEDPWGPVGTGAESGGSLRSRGPIGDESVDQPALVRQGKTVPRGDELEASEPW